MKTEFQDLDLTQVAFQFLFIRNYSTDVLDEEK